MSLLPPLPFNISAGDTGQLAQALSWLVGQINALPAPPPPTPPYVNQSANLLQNLTLVASRSGNAETWSIKTLAGGDPSASDAISIGFMDPATGTFSLQTLTAPLSLTVPSGAPLGATSAVPFRVWLVLFNDAGTLRLGVINCYTGTGIVGLEDNGSASSTAMSGSANSGGIFYTGTAVTSKPYRILGRLDYTLTTAGTWVTAPTTIHLFSLGSKLPGDVVTFAMTETGTLDTGTTTTIPTDNTIPQSNEGVAFSGLDTSITPKAAANLLRIKVHAMIENTASNEIGCVLFQDSGANGIAATQENNSVAGSRYVATFSHKQLALATSSTTFKIRAGGGLAGTTRFNSSAGAALYGGIIASSLTVEEIMV